MTTPGSTGSCPEPVNVGTNTSWIPFGTGCFMFFNAAKQSFIEANFECRNLGAQLASFHSDAQVLFAAAHLDKVALNVWIGLYRSGDSKILSCTLQIHEVLKKFT